MHMEFGGNARASEFFLSHGVRGKVDYASPLAGQYREVLKAAVQRALESRMACMSCNPESVVVDTDLPSSHNDSMDSLRSEDATSSRAEVCESSTSEPAPPTLMMVHQTTTFATSTRPILPGRPKAQVIDDFDFDDVPVKESAVGSAKMSPAVTPATQPVLTAKYGGIMEPPLPPRKSSS